MEKQKSFHIVMEKQISFMGSERKKNRESLRKHGDLPIHLATREGKLSKVKEIIQNYSNYQTKYLLAKQNLVERSLFMTLQRMGMLWLLARYLSTWTCKLLLLQPGMAMIHSILLQSRVILVRYNMELCLGLMSL